MSETFDSYHDGMHAVPGRAWAWNMYGPGLENIGLDAQPERVDIPEPGPDQLLVRIDSVGMCFSDLKIVKQGGAHPKLYGRDLAHSPTRLGHEVSLTIMRVGANLRDRYTPGQRCAVQPDIYQEGRSTAYGYTVPGGLIQYHLIGPEVLVTDDGPCLLPLSEHMGYAESALLEPWGCVMAAYTQRRRLQIKVGGTLWIVGRPGDDTPYTASAGLSAPARIVLTDVSPAVHALAAQSGAQLFIRNTLAPDGYAALSDELTGDAGFDDIIALDPRSALAVGALARQVARRGTLNLVGTTALDGLVDADVGRLHYDYVAFVGCSGPDLSAAYGETRNRCDLRCRRHDGDRRRRRADGANAFAARA